ncbi:MAG: hypothetical protein ABR941_12080 [Thermoleophilia bacterium]
MRNVVISPTPVHGDFVRLHITSLPGNGKCFIRISGDGTNTFWYRTGLVYAS